MEELHRQVQGVLRAREGGVEEEEPAALLEVLRQLGPAPQVLPQAGYSWQGINFPPCDELDTLLLQLGALAGTEADTVLLSLYHSTLLLRHQPRFLPKRRVCEAWVASYNPWVLIAHQSNHEVDILVATPHKVHLGGEVHDEGLQAGVPGEGVGGAEGEGEEVRHGSCQEARLRRLGRLQGGDGHGGLLLLELTLPLHLLHLAS